MAADLVALEGLFLGLADKTRLRLLGLMAGGPVSVGHLVAETGESQPKISRHLAYLRNVGLVDATRDGKWIYYGVAELTDRSADLVFRRVVEQLSGKSEPAKSPSTGRPHVRRPEPEVVPEIEYFRYEKISYDEATSITEWEYPSDEAHNELDVFLL